MVGCRQPALNAVVVPFAREYRDSAVISRVVRPISPGSRLRADLQRRRRRARPCVELLHNLRAGQPRADRPQPGGPAGVHDADRLSARPAGLCRGSRHPAEARRRRCAVEHANGRRSPKARPRTRRSDQHARDSGNRAVSLFYRVHLIGARPTGEAVVLFYLAWSRRE
jgi:hypothetical protein